MSAACPKHQHIVLIDDNPADVYRTKVAIEAVYFQVQLTNFRSALEALRALCPVPDSRLEPLVPDLILVGLNTAASDAVEVLTRIRANPGLSGVPVALIASPHTPMGKYRAQLPSDMTYIQKPADLQAFIEEVGGAIVQLLTADRVQSRNG